MSGGRLHWKMPEPVTLSCLHRSVDITCQESCYLISKRMFHLAKTQISSLKEGCTLT